MTRRTFWKTVYYLVVIAANAWTIWGIWKDYQELRELERKNPYPV